MSVLSISSRSPSQATFAPKRSIRLDLIRGVRQVGDVGQDDLALRQNNGGHDGKRGVLAAPNVYDSFETSSALNLKNVHFKPSFRGWPMLSLILFNFPLQVQILPGWTILSYLGIRP